MHAFNYELYEIKLMDNQVNEMSCDVIITVCSYTHYPFFFLAEFSEDGIWDYMLKIS